MQGKWGKHENAINHFNEIIVIDYYLKECTKKKKIYMCKKYHKGLNEHIFFSSLKLYRWNFEFEPRTICTYNLYFWVQSSGYII